MNSENERGPWIEMRERSWEAKGVMRIFVGALEPGLKRDG
jgi:hypothetical protein